MSLVTLQEVLKNNNEKGAVGAFSTYDLFTLQGVIAGAESTGLPVITMIGAPVLARKGNEEIGELAVKLAKQAKVPVVVFLDHAKNFEACMRALRLGFSAVMIDGSYLSFNENVKVTKKVVEAAKAVGASVEAELGALAGREDGEAAVRSKLTNPNDVPRFAESTNVDALAVSIGNAHGIYKGEPKLCFDIVEESAKLTNTPLVLHGGTGLTKEQFAKAIASGMKKVNIGTQIKVTYMDTFVAMHNKNQQAYDLIGVPQACKDAVADVAKSYLEFFASEWRNL